MSQEIELKLALPPEGPERLRRHPRLAALPTEDRILANTYFDTPDGALEAARVALRIRDTGKGRVQTLKTTGNGQGGLSVRGEWEWPIDENRPGSRGAQDVWRPCRRWATRHCSRPGTALRHRLRPPHLDRRASSRPHRGGAG